MHARRCGSSMSTLSPVTDTLCQCSPHAGPSMSAGLTSRSVTSGIRARPGLPSSRVLFMAVAGSFR
ncbi:hypothetical protein ACFONI_01555 [Aeromonas media]|uniref:hypothetical protein n=1 Tax=Aeromonas media TaxID=651 RepID=UPI00361A04FF